MEIKYENEIKEIEEDLIEFSITLIEGKKFLTGLSKRIRDLSKNKIQKKKKIFLLGETGVGKSTLINYIEDKILAPNPNMMLRQL